MLSAQAQATPRQHPGLQIPVRFGALQLTWSMQDVHLDQRPIIVVFEHEPKGYRTYPPESSFVSLRALRDPELSDPTQTRTSGRVG